MRDTLKKWLRKDVRQKMMETQMSQNLWRGVCWYLLSLNFWHSDLYDTAMLSPGICKRERIKSSENLKLRRSLCQSFKLKVIFLNTKRSGCYMAYYLGWREEWCEWIDLSTSGLDCGEACSLTGSSMVNHFVV